MPIVSRLFILLLPKQIRYRYGLYDEVSISTGFRVRHCNWIRFLRVSDTYGPQVSARIFFCCFGWMLIGDRACANLLVHLSAQVNIVCTKVKGEPLYEVVKPLAAHQELVVFYLPEGPARPEELFFVHMRSTLYRRTMDSILEGECATPSLCVFACVAPIVRQLRAPVARVSTPKMASSNCAKPFRPQKPTQAERSSATRTHISTM